MKRFFSLLTLLALFCPAFSQVNSETLGLEIDFDNANFYGTSGPVYASYEDKFAEMKNNFYKCFAYGFNNNAFESKIRTITVGIMDDANRVIKIGNIKIDNDGDISANASIYSKKTNQIVKTEKIKADGDSEKGEFYINYDKNNSSVFMFHLYLAAFTLGVNAKKGLFKL